MTDSLLRSIYYDASHEASFSGLSKLYAAARKVPGARVSKEDVQAWLRKETTYTLHKQARRRFRRNPYISTAIGEHCQTDLVDLAAYADENDGFSYLMTFIDIFSKKATAVPLKTKSMNDVSRAFTIIFKTFVCCNLRSDRGLEFRNAAVARVMRLYNVNLTFCYNQDIKASVVERFNRSLKTKMFKFFTANATRRYVDVLPKLLESYNKSFHRSIRMAPNDVSAENSDTVFRNLYGYENVRDMVLNGVPERSKFHVGDTVRVRYVLTPMDKGYLPSFSDQVYKVSAIVKGAPRTMYRLTDFQDLVLNQKFYSEDLQLVTDVSYRVERILQKRKGSALVRWLNHPSSADSWVPLKSLKNVSQ